MKVTDIISQLCNAAAKGDLAVIEKLINMGLDPNTSDYDGRTALHISAAEGHLKLVQYLVAEGAKVNITDRWRETPLSDALRHGHDDVASFLKGKGGKLKNTKNTKPFKFVKEEPQDGGEYFVSQKKPSKPRGSRTSPRNSGECIMS
jgi:ankyrin repeat protein